MNIEEVRLANQRLQAYIKGVNDGVDDRELEVSIYGEQCLDIATELQCDEALLLTWANDELARRDAEAAERELPITEEWLKSMGATIDAEDGVIELGWLAGELVILSGGLLSWTVDCVEIGELKTRGQLLDVRNGIARS